MKYTWRVLPTLFLLSTLFSFTPRMKAQSAPPLDEHTTLSLQATYARSNAQFDPTEESIVKSGYALMMLAQYERTHHVGNYAGNIALSREEFMRAQQFGTDVSKYLKYLDQIPTMPEVAPALVTTPNPAAAATPVYEPSNTPKEAPAIIESQWKTVTLKPDIQHRYATLLDKTISQLSKTWMVNRYYPGSVDDLVVLADVKNPTLIKVRGSYHYRGWLPDSTGWAELHLRNKHPLCVEFHDGRGECKPVSEDVVGIANSNVEAKVIVGDKAKPGSPLALANQCLNLAYLSSSTTTTYTDSYMVGKEEHTSYSGVSNVHFKCGEKPGYTHVRTSFKPGTVMNGVCTIGTDSPYQNKWEKANFSLIDDRLKLRNIGLQRGFYNCIYAVQYWQYNNDESME